MNDVVPSAGQLPPTVDPSGFGEVAEQIFVIPNRGVPLAPNIGLIGGRDAVLVVDTGMGPANGAIVLEAPRRMAKGRKLILTLTHFHPEHGFGAQAFKGNARITYNRAQRDELQAKGEAYLGMFRGFGPNVAAALEGTELVMPDDVYDGDHTEIDLGGGRIVELRTFGQAHTRGDQVVWVPVERIVFTGDLVEDAGFPIFPWFPPNDVDVDARRWVAILTELERWSPAVVVPGHGDVRGHRGLTAVRDYMVDLAQRVAERRQHGDEADKIVAELAPVIRAEHPDWSSPEWIDFAIRHYATHD